MAGTTFGAKSWKWLEGSTDFPKITKNEETQTDSKTTFGKYRKITSNDRGIIEDWCDRVRENSKTIRSDQFYEERAVDVGFQEQRKSSSLKKRKRDKLAKERPKNGSRNIPIKDYRASIARNMETLRRSLPPQSQFETLVSEPEKGKRKFGDSMSHVRNDNFMISNKSVRHSRRSLRKRESGTPKI